MVEFVFMHFRLVTILFFVLLRSSTVTAQCVDKEFLLKRLNFLGNSASISSQNKLKELIQFEDKLKRCSLTHDSLYPLLLRRIGIVYYQSADYINAIHYTAESTKILRLLGESQTNLQQLSNCYYNLRVYF